MSSVHLTQSGRPKQYFEYTMDTEGNPQEHSKVAKGPKRYYCTPIRKLVRSSGIKKLSKKDPNVLGASFLYKQSLKDNNLKLAKALDESKQDNAKLEKAIIELKQEKSELEAYNSILRRNAKPINDELEIEVQKRIELRIEKVRKYVESSATYLRQAADRMNDAAKICDLATEVHNIDQIVKDTLEFSQMITPDHSLLKSSKLGNKISIYGNSRTPLTSKINIPPVSTENLELPSLSPEHDEEDETRSSRLSDVRESAEFERRSGQYVATRSKRRTNRISNSRGSLELGQSASASTSPQPLPTLHTGQIADHVYDHPTLVHDCSITSDSTTTSKHDPMNMTLVDMSIESLEMSKESLEMSKETCVSMSISPEKIEIAEAVSPDKPVASLIPENSDDSGSVEAEQESVNIESPEKQPTRTSRRINALVRPNYQEEHSPEQERSERPVKQTIDTQPVQPDSEPIRQVEVRCKAGQFKVVVGDRDGGPISQSKRRKTKSSLKILQQEEPGIYDFPSTPTNVVSSNTTNGAVPEKSFSVFDLSCTAEKITREVTLAKQLHAKQKQTEQEMKAHNKKAIRKMNSKKNSVRTSESTEHTCADKTEEGSSKQLNKQNVPVEQNKHSHEEKQRAMKKSSETYCTGDSSDRKSLHKSRGEVQKTVNENITQKENITNDQNITRRKLGKSSLMTSDKTNGFSRHDENDVLKEESNRHIDNVNVRGENLKKLKEVDNNKNLYSRKKKCSEVNSEKSEPSEHNGSPKRARRAASTNINFKEPSLNSKLRKGDKFTYAFDEAELQKAKKKKNAKRKSNLSN